jgi:integrase
MTSLRAAVIAMAFRGFRIGALAGLTVTGSRFTTTSKGKAWTGELPPRVMAALRDRGRHPFEGVKAGTTAAHFKRVTRRLAATGEIAHAYSVHDLRHFYATTEYRKDRDIFRVSGLLNHADVKVTMKYLHDIGATKGRGK